MKYICINPFANPPGNPIKIADVTVDGKAVKQEHVEVDGKPDIRHVHKGAIFDIGSATEFADLAPAEKTLVSQLHVSKKIAVATPQTIARVTKEVESEAKMAERDAKRDAKSDPMKAIADVLAGFQKTQETLAASITALTAKLAPEKK